MMGYGGGTTNREQVEQLREAGWGMMIGPQNPKQGTLPYAVDNGAFYLWKRKKPFDGAAFLKMIDRVLKFDLAPDFATCPDKVAAGAESLEFSMSWIDRLPAQWPWYFVVQDGMTSCGVLEVLGRFAGIFVGGTSEWKMRTLPAWAKLAHQEGKKLHVGRVNTLPRAFVAAKVMGADSIDGTNWNRLWRMDRSTGRPRKVAKPLDVVRDPQLALDLYGLIERRGM